VLQLEVLDSSMAPKPTAGSPSRLRSASAKVVDESSQAKRKGGSAEINEILTNEFKETVQAFVSMYGPDKKNDSFLLAEANKVVSAFGQTVQHLSAASWRCAMSEKQGQSLLHISDGVVPAIETVLTNVSGVNARAALARSLEPAKLLGVMRLGLEVSAIYCELAGMFGAPATLMVDDVNAKVVQCLKHCVRQLVVPLLNSSDKSGADPLPFSKEETRNFCQSVGAAMVAMHELLCRRKCADEQLHQLVHLCMGVFFYQDVDFRLCAAAEEVLVTLFCRHASMSSSIIQEFLVGVTKLPTGKAAKKFQLPVPQDNADHGLSTWTHLLLRLIQSTCLPLREQLGGKIDFETVGQCRSGAQPALHQLTSGLIQRLLLTRARDDDLRAIFNDLIEEFLMACLKPSWPGGLAMLRTVFYQLIGLVQQGKRKELADASLREFCLKMISKIICHLSHHQVEAADQVIKLPPWTQASDKQTKEYRMLQNVALRVSL
jgi:hypothetical protein